MGEQVGWNKINPQKGPCLKKKGGSNQKHFTT